MLVNTILVVRFNAIFQTFYGIEGLRKYQVFLASLANIIICATTATWMETRVVEPPAGFPWPGCMLSQYPNTALTIPACMKLKFRSFGDITIHNIKEEIRNIKPVTLTLVRDSVLFYFPMFGKSAKAKGASTCRANCVPRNLGILVASVPVMALYHTDLANVTIPIIIALYSFCASRLIIYTRENFTRSSRDVSSRGINPIDFASRSLTVSHAGTHV
ncbi:hypothetical protein EDD17DRAFT_1549993 [Pisolithus thermaeus]|nr:hypothetical protein EDD17DRAFT_1549993 [Pisolithus thermaeus]